MRTLIHFLAAVVAVGLCPDLPGAGTEKDLCIVALGDSITRGARPAKGSIPAVLPGETFCALLEKDLAAQGRTVRVVNSGVPSNRTDQGVARLEKDVLAHGPDVVLIMFGTNDSCHDSGQSGPRLPLADYERNLTRLVSSIREAGGTPVLMTPPPLREGWGFTRNEVYKNLGANGPLLSYVQACRNVAEKTGIPLIDHFEIWSVQGKDFVAAKLPDGCHPNAAGHGFLAQTILPVVEQQLSPGTSKRSNPVIAHP